MAWDSHTARSPSSITGTRPCGFNARNDGSSSLPKSPPAGTCAWARPSSPTSQSTFWTLKELRRPQTLSIGASLSWLTSRCAAALPCRSGHDNAVDAPMASALQPRRHVLVLALKLHAGRERHRLHQRRKVLLQILIGIG